MLTFDWGFEAEFDFEGDSWSMSWNRSLVKNESWDLRFFKILRLWGLVEILTLKFDLTQEQFFGDSTTIFSIVSW